MNCSHKRSNSVDHTYRSSITSNLSLGHRTGSSSVTPPESPTFNCKTTPMKQAYFPLEIDLDEVTKHSQKLEARLAQQSAGKSDLYWKPDTVHMNLSEIAPWHSKGVQNKDGLHLNRTVSPTTRLQSGIEERPERFQLPQLSETLIQKYQTQDLKQTKSSRFLRRLSKKLENMI
ncbi:hypothetical protein PSN45_004559 [Yamadazyma tenuis]|uniref:Uncharacterized protein n=1 Tax=Candida tenuis (strain ATCC 10573 / BCRC 21748 / CBS 615 / JCM 9827 / NBRC 10315 / NRRL Y-1498 / VKM Y-70) TaxID=590646 RepID=G3B595_CANTC|nr:uncharacterized protein CANTEDRAFT_135000 [Yamadazyma tenuis ATCC 10573]EGV63164.1 hypothetical protein CANTEDRAFT_135000 [Yamadazyma tenuis ATCC 10573]WEJ97013.1 hypothetical protein PSN45_004559 [Yamadazyma tenuis]